MIIYIISEGTVLKIDINIEHRWKFSMKRNGAQKYLTGIQTR